jgi:hypothetical protein
MYRYDFQGNLLVSKMLECLNELSKVNPKKTVVTSFDLVSREKNEADAELLSYSENLYGTESNYDGNFDTDINVEIDDLRPLWLDSSESESNLPGGSHDGGGDLPITFSSAARFAVKLAYLIRERKLRGIFRV